MLGLSAEEGTLPFTGRKRRDGRILGMEPINRLGRWLGRRQQGFRYCPVCRVEISPGEGVMGVENTMCCTVEHADDYARERAW